MMFVKISHRHLAGDPWLDDQRGCYSPLTGETGPRAWHSVANEFGNSFPHPTPHSRKLQNNSDTRYAKYRQRCPNYSVTHVPLHTSDQGMKTEMTINRIS